MYFIFFPLPSAATSQVISARAQLLRRKIQTAPSEFHSFLCLSPPPSSAVHAHIKEAVAAEKSVARDALPWSDLLASRRDESYCFVWAKYIVCVPLPAELSVALARAALPTSSSERWMFALSRAVPTQLKFIPIDRRRAQWSRETRPNTAPRNPITMKMSDEKTLHKNEVIKYSEKCSQTILGIVSNLKQYSTFEWKKYWNFRCVFGIKCCRLLF